ncbi:transposase [Streptomyces mirabilis]|nr:transposase [Streptomyces mirabilis]
MKKIRSRWRALPAGKIAGTVLAVLRCDQRPGDLAGGNGIHRTTVTRWVREVVGLLAARAPRLDRALNKIARKGGGIVLLDGTLIRTRRRTGAENRKNYSGKNKCHGLLVIALTDDRGRLLWVSAARAGRTSETTACRHDQLTQKLRATGLGAVTDLGFVGLDDSGPGRRPGSDHRLQSGTESAPDAWAESVQQGTGSREGPGRAQLRQPQELARARQGPHRPDVGDRPGQALLVLTNREISR